MMRENSSSMLSHSPGSLSLQQGAPSSLLLISGDWTLPHYARLQKQIAPHHNQLNDNVQISWDELGALDTAGATLIIELIGPARLQQLTENNTPLSAERLALLLCVARALDAMTDKDTEPKSSIINDLLTHIGKTTEQIGKQQIDLLGFIGLTVETLITTVLRPRRWRITSLIAHIEQTGFIFPILQ